MAGLRTTRKTAPIVTMVQTNKQTNKKGKSICIKKKKKKEKKKNKKKKKKDRLWRYLHYQYHVSKTKVKPAK